MKTRLAASLGHAAAARAYAAMAREVAAGVRRLSGVRTAWVYDGSRDLRWLGVFGGDRWTQGKGDLGARLTRAFERSFREGARRVCVIGTDSPDLPAGRIKEAFSALRRSEVVIGPSRDGGYYLLGLRRPRPDLFARIPWSGKGVFAETLRRAPGARVLGRHYDVDAPVDLLTWVLRGL